VIPAGKKRFWIKAKKFSEAQIVFVLKKAEEEMAIEE